MGTRNTDHGKGICAGCREEKSLTANLRIRSHKIDGVSCVGGSDLPYDPAKDTATGLDILADGTPVDDDPFGDADDTSSDPTDASTWTTEVDDRPTLFDVRNARKVIDSTLDKTSAAPEEVLAEAERILIRWENEGVKGGERPGTSTVLPEMGQTDHVHQYEYGDDNNGHSGSFCDCGKEEPIRLPAKPAHGGPNPHRAPLPTVATYTDDRTPEQQAEIDRRRKDPRGHLQETLLSAKSAVSDDVNVFMNGSAKTSGSTAADVNDFMGGDEPEEEKTPQWFPARYDGNCESCGADFGEGEEIRADGSGGWEARECCGSDDTSPAAAPQERPRIVYPKPQVRNGRYHLPHPETGEKANWTRVTNFNKKASDHFALEQWGNRSLAVGLAKRPDLLKQVQGKDVKADRNFLNKLAEEAKQAAGSKDRARLGTIMHKHTEQVDAGHKTLADVPEQFRNDVAVYQAKMKEVGLMMVPHLMERSTVVTELGVAGTFDGITRCPDGTYAVADKKTGATLEYNQFEIAIQLAVYAHGINTAGIATAVPSDIEGEPPTWVWEKPLDEDGNVIKVREDIGYVIHIPYGEDACFVYDIPLTIGWDGAQLCKRVQEAQKIKHIITAVPAAKPYGIVAELEKATAGAGTVDRGFVAPTAANTGRTSAMDWMERFAAVTSKDEALKLYRGAKAEGVNLDTLKAMVEVGKGALKALATKPAPEPAADPWPVQNPVPPEQSWEDKFAAVISKTEAGTLYRSAKATGMSSGRLVELAEIGKAALKKLEEAATFPDRAPVLTWEDRFMLVTSREEATELYREAKDQVSPERLTDLIERGKKALVANAPAKATIPEPVFREPAAPPSWEDRFKAVTTKDQAKELYAKARAEVATLGMTRLTALIALGKEALSFHEEPPF